MLNSLYEVALEKKFGYALVSVVSYPGYGIGNLHAIRPLDYYSPQPFSIQNEQLQYIDQVAAPILSLAKPPSRGPNKWKLLSKFDDGKEFELPICICDFTTQCRTMLDWNLIEWDVIFNLERERVNYHKYWQVAHLPQWGMGTPNFVLMHLTMLWMRLTGKDIREYFNTEEENTSEQFLYKLVTNQKLYSELAVEDRNRILY
jgi:hypothetical protein